MLNIQTAVGCLKLAEPATWTDHEGKERRTPVGKKLHMARYPLHAALRAFVYRRDGFRCQHCGTAALPMPADPSTYDGFTSPLTTRRSRCGMFQVIMVIDHIISRRNGGSNHPLNLQTLCDSCNSSKAGLVDAKGAPSWRASEP